MEAPKLFSLSFICKCNGTNGALYDSDQLKNSYRQKTGNFLNIRQ